MKQDKLLGKEYLGDSVYVEHRNGILCIYTYNGLGKKNHIILEEGVMESLINYYQRSLKVRQSLA